MEQTLVVLIHIYVCICISMYVLCVPVVGFVLSVLHLEGRLDVVVLIVCVCVCARVCGQVS